MNPVAGKLIKHGRAEGKVAGKVEGRAERQV